MRFACSLVLVLWSGAAMANCQGQTQLDMNACAAARYAAADAQLNAAWPAAKGYMDGIGAGATLLDAQRKWLAFRDANCTAESAPYAGGSIQPLVWYGCLERLTLARTRDLQAHMRP